MGAGGAGTLSGMGVDIDKPALVFAGLVYFICLSVPLASVAWVTAAADPGGAQIHAPD